MPAPEPDPRARNLCVWILSCILFGVIITGCALLIHGVFLEGGLRSATAGLILIAIPWVFWFLTYLYRGIRRLIIWAFNSNGAGGGGSVKGSGGGNAPSKRGSIANDSPVDSPGAAAGRKVQFGDVNVIDDDTGHDDNQKTSASSTGSDNDSSSPLSECEKPFAPSTPSC